jgi:hypothetical protein
MSYSNWRRHNSPSISQTPYQTLIIPCPNLDPFYQLILLKNSISEISSEQKKDPRKKERGVRIEKQKRWNLIWKAPYFKEKRRGDEIYKLLGEILLKERKKERRSHFPIVQNPICGLIHTHTSFAFTLPSISWLFPFLPPFTTPFFINHDYLPHKLSRIFLYFYNIQGVA